MTEYWLERVTPRDIDEKLFKYFLESAEKVASIFEHKFNWKHFALKHYAEHHRIIICRKKGRPVGLMLSRLYPSIFDPDVKILYQDLLFAEPKTRATILLLKDYVDFGKANSNHVITCLTESTNIKRRSLEKLGFKKMEELYRMEISK